jgi:hypothetical protein
MAGPTQQTNSWLVPYWKPPLAPPTPAGTKASTATTNIGHCGTPSILNRARKALSPAPTPAPLMKRDNKVRRETAPEKANIAQAIPIPTILNTAPRSTPRAVRPGGTKTSCIFSVLSLPGATHYSDHPIFCTILYFEATSPYCMPETSCLGLPVRNALAADYCSGVVVLHILGPIINPGAPIGHTVTAAYIVANRQALVFVHGFPVATMAAYKGYRRERFSGLLPVSDEFVAINAPHIHGIYMVFPFLDPGAHGPNDITIK